jgi:hypothetical protein
MSLTTKASNAIQELTRQGQSLWLDNLRRELIFSGELVRLRDLGLVNQLVPGAALSWERRCEVGSCSSRSEGWHVARYSVRPYQRR